MKNLLSCTILALMLCVTTLQAQQEYTVDGKSYELYTEIEGPLTLLWNTVEGEYRYFSKKGNNIVELKNTKVDGRYQEEFKEALRLQTDDAKVSVANVNLTKPGLSAFVIKYNKAKDANYSHETKSIKLNTRLGVFAGASNSAYTTNDNNAITPVAGVDFEIVDNVRLKRHAMVFRFKQTFKNPDNNSAFTQFSLNYRFKIVKTQKFDLFINTKFLAYTYSKKEIPVQDPDTNIITIVDNSGGSFNTPAAFGIGADYAIGNGYITFSYNDIVAIGVDNNGEFPVDLTLGYKFNL
ncbi:hypothetical protein [Ulvibacter antarcticus]|uniref:Outer membrane protein with beta-barrel domain n=1 Tax=Ulvibacter antarcticus TaxID=442714 RepID=A0A3L9Z2N0_9FLAO|nr:hypothetical protein [Ulvibacter antarcticus]RMA66400.1 hypothetical protein BXY75_0824 [Ulvibacter antarcticus]